MHIIYIILSVYRCNDSYKISLLPANVKKADWLRHQLDGSWYRRVGFITMDNERVGYAVQATANVGAVSLEYAGGKISADILPENYSHHSDRLYIAFDATNSMLLKSKFCPFHVSFEACTFLSRVVFVLKHSYFRNLFSSVEKISSEMISRIVPNQDSFKVNSSSLVDIHSAFKESKNCSPDQFQALKVIASCPSDGPPVVIAGPFGTGKSYVLALAARYFLFESQQTKRVARILVCTQQRVSAESFASMYLKMSVADKDGKHVRIIQNRGRKDYLLNKKRLYCTVDDFKRAFDRSSNSAGLDNTVVITTCLTARNLVRFIPLGHFTHILIDEGAQMREPEAVAPLSMAHHKNTKIVIAGDEKQVCNIILYSAIICIGIECPYFCQEVERPSLSVKLSCFQFMRSHNFVNVLCIVPLKVYILATCMCCD